MKKLPLISLVSFFILIPTITLAEEKNGYEYNEKEKIASNNYYFFLEPSNTSELNTSRKTTNYTLYSKFTQTWLKVNPHEIKLSNTCKKKELDENLYNGEEECWSYRRYYYILDKIASQGAIKASEMDSSYYTRELKSGSNIYYEHGGYKQNLGDPWQNAITPDPSNVQDGKLIVEADAGNIINSYKYRSLACSSVKTTNNVELIDTNGNKINNGEMINDRSTIIEINRKYGTYTIGEPPSKENNSNCNGLYPTKDIDSSMYEYQNDVIYSPVLYNIKTTDVQKECISKEAPIKGTCNGTSNSSNIKCLKTIVSGNSKGEVKLDQTATLTNILTPTKIYQGGGIKLGFMYYNTVKWEFSNEEKYGDDSEIRKLLRSKLKSINEIENEIKVKVSLKDEEDDDKKYIIKNIQKKCEQKGDFKEGETVTTTCTFLLPESIVELGTGKVKYNNSPGQGINNEYYTPITYTGNLYLEAEISNIGVLDEAEVDGWTDNWTLKYDGENDDSCKVNVTSRLYKPDQSNKYAFTYRPIDLNNPFPNRNAGVNWYDWYSIPANKERLKSSYSKKEYQVELDNQSVSKIKEDNKNNNYLNWTGINKETGKSDFIDKYNIVRIQEGGNP